MLLRFINAVSGRAPHRALAFCLLASTRHNSFLLLNVEFFFGEVSDGRADVEIIGGFGLKFSERSPMRATVWIGNKAQVGSFQILIPLPLRFK